ncbi:ABC-type nitrate/sulfonate/bicarbonate transport system substrate-binding protein [Sphingobium sp. B1D7B]|uniref:ABC transporter substrate-binding protein n=1 Tax=Sphingobium sp. B1D7B TaxID=2940578 RepID=UPI0022240858|nr:ABC transporter substrate-binding protein [Sphingobium sp. B1D7B]MCW2404617.1 ABC-type nitrate/sulfonate/bicarbonate transport system substrate-binding protein [Sphingobium sp. B1D7B]
MSQKLDTLWYTRCPVPTGLGIAIQQGWLEEAFGAQGTSLSSLLESNDFSKRESHFSHTVQNSVRHGGNIPAISAKARGRDTRVLGLSWADETQLILASPESSITSVRDLKGRRFALPNWKTVEIDFTRAQAVRGLENALRLEGLEVADVEIVDQDIETHYSDGQAQTVGGTLAWNGRSTSRARANNLELIALLRGEVDAIFLKGAHGAQVAHQFGLTTVIDTGIHPDPLVRANNGTPRTLAVDGHLVDNHFDAAVTIVEQVLRAEHWAQSHASDVRRYLARETNSSEYWVSTAYGSDAQTKLKTDLAEQSIVAIQDFTDFLHRWNFIPQSFDVRQWIDPRPLEAARSLALAS